MTGMTTRLSVWVLIVGFLGHAPGLNFLFHRSLPSAARRENLFAIGTTLIALGAAAMLGGGLRCLGMVWLAGHLAWGARIVWILRHEQVRKNESVEEMVIGEERGSFGDR